MDGKFVGFVITVQKICFSALINALIKHAKG
jgi:hypothetical protein